jgi:Transposase IS66 family
MGPSSGAQQGSCSKPRESAGHQIAMRAVNSSSIAAAGDAPRWRTLRVHSDVAKAMDYMLKRWDSFTRFLEDGRICLTNNAADVLGGIALGPFVVLKAALMKPGAAGGKSSRAQKGVATYPARSTNPGISICHSRFTIKRATRINFPAQIS